MPTLGSLARLLVVLLALAPAARAGEEPRWLRVDRVEGESLTLEVAERRYARADGTGPELGLVGVVHVADAAYYRALAQHLNGYEVVLYESVKPAGSAAPAGDTDEEKAASTRRALRFLSSLVEAYRAAKAQLPPDLESLSEWVRTWDARLQDFLALCLIDAWGRRVSYLPDAEAGYAFRSFGADGAEGGTGVADDLFVGSADAVPPLARPRGDSLQAAFAKTLHLSFQLDEIDYGADNWRPSDMAFDEVRAAIRGRGGDPSALNGSLTGSSFAEGFARLVLGLVRIGDALSGGYFGDAMKAMVIEMLGEESDDPTMGGAFSEAVMRAIIEDRNQHVVEDLSRTLEAEPGIRSIAVFYGAGHMADLEKRLSEQLSYEPIEDSVTWFPAMRLDLATSHVDQDVLDQMREMVRSRLSRMRRKK